MNISFQNIINAERPEGEIMDIKNANWEGIFLRVYVRFSSLDDKKGLKKEILKYSANTILNRYMKTVKSCIKNNIRISFIQMPDISNIGFQLNNEEVTLSELETSFDSCCELCKLADCGFIVMETPFDSIKNDLRRRALHDYFIRSAKKAKKYGIILLLKNKGRIIGGHVTRGFCSDAIETVEWIDSLNLEIGYDMFGFCVDIGICNICGNDFQSYVRTIGKRIKAVILSDNTGIRMQCAMLPFTYPHDGQAMNHWLGIIRGLRDINFDGELAIDFSSTLSSFSPLLKTYLYPLAKAIGDYFKWQIGIEDNLKKYDKLVLFGAGNMCRNYMKNYGEKYPPLFTCDNNTKLWGTEFCGLEVKSPEALKELSDDCGIFICNIYYREIEEQLKSMGIDKNIEYFNDEYMPTFYYDRIEREK